MAVGRGGGAYAGGCGGEPPWRLELVGTHYCDRYHLGIDDAEDLQPSTLHHFTSFLTGPEVYNA